MRLKKRQSAKFLENTLTKHEAQDPIIMTNMATRGIQLSIRHIKMNKSCPIYGYTPYIT